MGFNQDSETAKRLSIIKRLLEGGVFDKAESMRPALQADKLHKEDGSVNLYIGDFKELGGYVTFGTYPQSKKADNVKIGKIIDKKRGYYLGSDSCMYAKVKKDYYKVEPIKWKVLSCANEWFIVADVILEPHCFDGSSSNYAKSEIRCWLNGEFFNKAFSNEQKNKIIVTVVDNSLSSTCDSKNPYTCDNTSDKVFLLSHKEAVQYLGEESRMREPTEYAIARGAFYNTDNNIIYMRNGKGCGVWWLRSPFHCNSEYARTVYPDGSFFDYHVPLTCRGVVPALKIKP